MAQYRHVGLMLMVKYQRRPMKDKLSAMLLVMEVMRFQMLYMILIEKQAGFFNRREGEACTDS